MSRREFSNFSEIFENPFEINQELFEFAQQKKAEGSKVVILSNVAQYQFEQIFSKGQAEIFDEIILSGNVGVLKPNPQIFEIALEKLGAKAGACVLIDDDERNIETFENLGGRGILFESNAEFFEKFQKSEKEEF